jgi:hypothetical protein
MQVYYKHWVVWQRLQTLFSQRSPVLGLVRSWFEWSGHVWHIRGNLKQTMAHVAKEKARLAQQQATLQGVLDANGNTKTHKHLDVWVK